ncbi:MAG: hypothetical protein ACJAWW_002443 [Sulfurimonas sp.]|jgi:hypothetical protein
MNKNLYTPKVFFVLSSIAILLFLLVVEGLYISSTKTISPELYAKRNDFVRMTGLPDLAISTEATFIRHRSMSDIFSIYKDDGSLREYFPSTYVYSHSHIINGYVNEK